MLADDVHDAGDVVVGIAEEFTQLDEGQGIQGGRFVPPWVMAGKVVGV
jgi:hypothetical protein